MKILAVLRIIWRRIRRTRKGKMIVNTKKQRIYLKNLFPTYISFCRPLPPSILAENGKTQETEHRFYVMSSSSDNSEAQLSDESTDEDGYAKILDDNQDINPPFKQYEVDNYTQFFVMPLPENLLIKSVTLPTKFIPVCTSTPIRRCVSDNPVVSTSGSNLHFWRLEVKRMSVPRSKPPPLPIEESDEDNLVVVDGKEQEFWELEIPRDEKLDAENASLYSDEPTLVLKEDPVQNLNETFIEEVTIYVDSDVESTANRTFIVDPSTAFLLNEIFMSKSVTV
ncbi:hypothetical protein RB195_005167 [Necator americanus]|uniref:Uncharacterized protein n=1 Tax=Necator americanus TaxID=51031 RepID=A0ABR1BQE7_NECAM